MSLLPLPTPPPLVKYLPYTQASATQREQLLAYLHQRLRHHFPTLSPTAWLRALFEFQPTLVLTGPAAVTLDAEELRQLVQHLSSSPELPLLDPPIYGLTALSLAQYCMRVRELAAAALPELAPGPGSSQLTALLTCLGQPYWLAEQVVQAWRWDLVSSPFLPPGLPGGGLPPCSEEMQRYLAQLGRAPAD